MSSERLRFLESGAEDLNTRLEFKRFQFAIPFTSLVMGLTRLAHWGKRGRVLAPHVVQFLGAMRCLSCLADWEGCD